MRKLIVAVALVSLGLTLFAQAPTSGADTQREAMKKLGFLVGHWSGPITVRRGPGEPLHLTQTEEIQYKLDGLVLLIEGTSRNPDGKVLFNALATVSFDDISHAYRIRAYNDGHYVDAEMTVVANGFSWSYASGPAQISNAMRLTDKGEWMETTDATFGGNPPMRSVDMLLQHQP